MYPCIKRESAKGREQKEGEKRTRGDRERMKERVMEKFERIVYLNTKLLTSKIIYSIILNCKVN